MELARILGVGLVTAVAALLLPAFLPFNLVKGGLNAALVLLLYKPVVTALRRARLAEPTQAGAGGRARGGIALRWRRFSCSPWPCAA